MRSKFDGALKLNNAPVPDEVYDAINSISKDTPRIFLSHQPRKYFEYSPSSKTKIFYLMRKPHATWFSMWKWYNRAAPSSKSSNDVPIRPNLVLLNSNLHRNENVMKNVYFTADASLESRVTVTNFTQDFISGMLPLPPRVREFGQEFAWSRHVTGWVDFMAQQATKVGNPFKDLRSHIILFEDSLNQPVTTIKAIAAACASKGWTHSIYHSASNSKADTYKANLIAKLTTYENQRAMTKVCHQNTTTITNRFFFSCCSHCLLCVKCTISWCTLASSILMTCHVVLTHISQHNRTARTTNHMNGSITLCSCPLLYRILSTEQHQYFPKLQTTHRHTFSSIR